MLHSLTLNNFQQHADKTFEFTSGLNLITGENWSGKTTVLRGILFALFGSSAVDAKATDLTTRGLNGMSVRLVIDVNDAKYVITRSRTTASITQGETALAAGQAETTREVERLLNTTSKHFKLLNLSPQGEADALFSMGSAAMSTLLNEITGADVVEAVLAASAEQAASLAWGTNTYESLATRNAETSKKLEERQSEHDELATWMVQAKLHQTYLLTQVAQTKEKVSELENLFIKAEMSRRELAEIDTRIERTVTLLADLDKELVPVKREDLEDLEQKRNDLRQAVQDDIWLREQIADLTREKEEKQAALSGLRARYVPLPEDAPSPDELLETKMRLDAELAKAAATEKQLAKIIEDAVCPTCGSTISEIDLEDVRKSHAEAVNEKGKLQANVDMFMDYYTKQCSLAAQHAEHVKKDQRLEEELAAINADLDVKTKASKEIDRSVVNKTYLLEIENAYDELAYAERLYAEKVTNRTRHQQHYDQDLARKTELEAEGPWPTEAEVLAARGLRDSARKGEEDWSQAVNEQTTRLAVLSSEVNMLNTNLHRDLEEQTKAREAHEHYLCYKELEKYLRQNRDKYLADIWSSILSYASQFITQATSGKIVSLGRAHNGFFYTEDDYEMPVALASGMQKAVLGVALKLALGAALGAGRKLLLLDEVTAAASDENSMLVCQLLAGYSGQVVMVSHRAADAAVADHAIALT